MRSSTSLFMGALLVGSILISFPYSVSNAQQAANQNLTKAQQAADQRNPEGYEYSLIIHMSVGYKKKVERTNMISISGFESAKHCATAKEGALNQLNNKTPFGSSQPIGTILILHNIICVQVKGPQ